MRELKIFEREGYTVDDLDPNDRWAFNTLVMVVEDILNYPYADREQWSLLKNLAIEITENVLDRVQAYAESHLTDILVSWIDMYPDEEVDNDE